MNKIYREDNGGKIFGEVFYGIVKNGNYYFTEITVFADGMIRCWELVDFETFKSKLKSGWIRINLPKNSKLFIRNLGTIDFNELQPEKSNEDFIKEIEDTIIRLNGGKGMYAKCIDLFKKYLLNDSEKNYLNLKIGFDNLPTHKKVLFEYVDYKDPLVELMKLEKANIKLTIEQRKYMLNDYFEDEWNDSDFKK